MTSPAQEGIEAARDEARYRQRAAELIAAGLAPAPDYADVDAAHHYAYGLAIAIDAYEHSRDAGRPRDEAAHTAAMIACYLDASYSVRAYAERNLPRAIEAAEEERAIDQTQRVIEATVAAYTTARDCDDHDYSDALVIAMKAAIAAGADVYEAAQTAAIAAENYDDDRRDEEHTNDYDLSTTEELLAEAAADDRDPAAASIIAALQFFWDNAPADLRLPAALAGAAYTDDGATLIGSSDDNDATTYYHITIRTKRPDDQNPQSEEPGSDCGPEAERIAADAIETAYLQMRSEATAGAERALANYARQIAYQQHSMSETQSHELNRLAQAVQDARQAESATRRNYGTRDAGTPA